METKHTPGPWSVAQHDHALVVCTESTSKTKYGASRYAAIGGFDRGDPEQLAEALANARLIAAAPELLDALVDARAAIAYAVLCIAIEREPTDAEVAKLIAMSKPDGDIGKINAAIAKATAPSADVNANGGEA